MNEKNFNSCSCNEKTKKDNLLSFFKSLIIKIFLFSISLFLLFSMILYYQIYNNNNFSDYFFVYLISLFFVLHCIFFIIIYKKNADFIKKILAVTDLLKLGLHQIHHGIKPIEIYYNNENEFGQLCKIYKILSDKIKEKELKNNINDEKRKVIFSGIIHDNKTLLTTLLGYSEALKMNKNLSTEKKEKYITGIYSCAEDLSELNETLSVFNKISKTNSLLHPKPLDFSKTIHKIVNPVADSLALKNVSITMNLAENLYINLDIKAFKRILLNLLANTIRYRKKQFSKITLKTYKESNFAVFSYSDDGPGVSKDNLPHLFEAYYRNPETKKTIQGSGLGLAIVAKIIEAHKGTYEAKSDNGLTIITRIPLIEREDSYD